MKNRILFFLFLSILNFSNCTIAGTHYLVNLTGEDLTIEMKSIDFQDLQIRTKHYNGGKIKFRSFQKMKLIETNPDSLDNSIQFVLSKGEFAFIGFGMNAHTYYNLDSFSAKGENTFVELNSTETIKNVKMKTQMGGYLKYVQTMILEND